MKGIVFTHFFEMVESEFGEEMVESLIDDAETSTNGVYITAGTYPAQDMVNLVSSLSKASKLPPPMLYRHYGNYLFKQLYSGYSFFPPEVLKSAFAFLDSINDYIHVEVRKLYPDAELPHFATHHRDEHKMVLEYTSSRRMSDLAYGLIEGCLKQFGETANIELEPVTEDGSKVLFTIKLNPG
jgi:hypothetical protein